MRDQAYDAIRQEWLNIKVLLLKMKCQRLFIFIKGRTAVYRANGSDEAAEPKQEPTDDKYLAYSHY